MRLQYAILALPQFKEHVFSQKKHSSSACEIFTLENFQVKAASLSKIDASLLYKQLFSVSQMELN